jgi:hypothetical protein
VSSYKRREPTLIDEGKLTLPIADFVQITRDDEGKKLMVAVLDKNVREQRALWGELILVSKGVATYT